jgi:hypothetical protein
MARISFPERGMGEHVDWALLRADMAVGMGAFSEAVYSNTKLALREREAARWTIALINHCVVCQDTRARDGHEHGVDEGFYGEVASWRTSTELSPRERLAAEFAQRAHADGALVLFGRCDEELGISYQPFVEALAHHAGHLDAEQVAHRVLVLASGQQAELARHRAFVVAGHPRRDHRRRVVAIVAAGDEPGAATGGAQQQEQEKDQPVRSAHVAVESRRRSTGSRQSC